MGLDHTYKVWEFPIGRGGSTVIGAKFELGRAWTGERLETLDVTGLV